MINLEQIKREIEHVVDKAQEGLVEMADAIVASAEQGVGSLRRIGEIIKSPEYQAHLRGFGNEQFVRGAMSAIAVSKIAGSEITTEQAVHQTESHLVTISAGGAVRFIASDNLLPLKSALGKSTTRRASHVEPNEADQWEADLGPVGGPVLGPFEKRSEALAAETEWLKQHVLGG